MASNLPTLRPNERTVVIGHSGTGKSTLALWLLTRSNLNRPVYVIDYKREDLISALIKQRIAKLWRNKTPGRFDRPGIYVVRPFLNTSDEFVDDFIWAAWKRKNCILFVDEMIFMDRYSNAMQTVMATGRSRNVEVIAGTQRPSGIEKRIFTEASYFAVFFLQWRKDWDTVREYTPLPDKEQADEQLPKHACYWYDVAKRHLVILEKFPYGDALIARLADERPVPFWW